MKNIELFASTEIMGAYTTSRLTAEQAEKFLADPYAMLPLAGVDLSHLSITAVSNSSDEVHIALPYYDALDKPSAVAIGDDDLDAVIGGEIIITIAFFGTGVALTALSVGSSVATGGAFIAGGIASAVVAGAVTAGAVAGTEAEEGK